MRKLILLAIIRLALGGMFGTEYHVAPTGDDSNNGLSFGGAFLHIQYCIGIVGPGDTCTIHAGIYNQLSGEPDFIIATGYAANGTNLGAGAITLRAYPGDTVLLRHQSQQSIMYVGAQYWIIDGIIIDGSNGYYACCGTGGTGLSIDGAHLRVQNVEVKNMVNVGIGSNEGSGPGNEFLNLRVHDNGTVLGSVQWHGVYVAGTGGLFNGGEYYNNSGYGIQLFHTGACGSDPNHPCLSDNTIQNVRVHHNNSEGGSGGVVIATGYRNRLLNSVIYANYNGGDAVGVDFRCQDCEVYNCTIVGDGTGRGVQIGVGDYTAQFGTIIKNNIVVDFSTAIADYTTVATISNNFTVGDPLFTDPTNGEFFLQSGSTARGAGINLTSVVIAPLTDIRGYIRATTDPWDIGAYAFMSAAPGQVMGSNRSRIHR